MRVRKVKDDPILIWTPGTMGMTLITQGTKEDN